MGKKLWILLLILAAVLLFGSLPVRYLSGNIVLSDAMRFIGLIPLISAIIVKFWDKNK